MTKNSPSAAEAAEPKTHARPVWNQTLNRVECAIWPHDHNGIKRYSVSICRSYFDKKKGKLVRNYFFDESDLQDVAASVSAAREYLKATTLENDAYVD